MSYKRLHSRLKGNSENKFDQLANAFMSNGPSSEPVFNANISHPTSSYDEEVNRIYSLDQKLGITFNRLNTHQRHAVFQPCNNAILSAMVGSGKTTVLIAKIFYLHFIKKVPFGEMVVLTFTNKAATEIKERINAFLNNEDASINKELRYFGTFHSVARQLLQEHPLLSDIGYQPDFMIMDEQEKQEFLQRLIAQENLNIKYQNKLSKRWRKYHASGEVMMGNMKQADELEQLIELAYAEKRTSNTMDFDDLITQCNSLLQEETPIHPQWIVVDEFQDCNEEQLQLINNIKSYTTQLFVVGDQNQSIYGWRGSKENVFQEAQSKWSATWMELPQNYRSTESILSAASALLQENEATLVATRQSGTPIDLVRHFDDQQEAYYLREQLINIQKDGIDLDTVAILFRTHQQIGIVETVFSQANIPFQLVKRTNLHDNVAQSYLLRLLKLCSNPNDVDACLALVCDTTFGTLKRNKTIIQHLHSRDKDTSALTATINYLESRKTFSTLHTSLLRSISLFEQRFWDSETFDTPYLLDYFGLQDILMPTSIHHKEYLSSIEEAWQQLQRYITKHSWSQANDIFHVALDQVVLEGTFQINDRIKEQNHGVHLLTIHASKGLEFDKIYLAGANSGIIPLTQNQKGSQHLKEEKRLLFVALTRGKDKVEIGWHAQPTLRGAEPSPSYFLNVIPDDLLNRRIVVDASKEAKPTETTDWLLDTKVKHKKYGKGRLTKINDKEITCAFEVVGEKSFSKAFAKALLERLD